MRIRNICCISDFCVFVFIKLKKLPPMAQKDKKEKDIKYYIFGLGV